jgi:type IV pilus assembly protein PilY1
MFAAFKNSRVAALMLGLSLCLGSVGSAIADDTEIYVSGQTPGSLVKPNVLLIVDTSMSMGIYNVTERATYNKNTTYSTSNPSVGDMTDWPACPAGRIYYSTDGATTPKCDAANTAWFTATENHCKKLKDALAGVAGRWSGKAAQWNTDSLSWENLVPGATGEVECFADNNVHGHNTSSTTTKKYARNGDASNKWTGSSSDVIAWAGRSGYTFFSSNWINWKRTTPKTTTMSRMQAAKNAVIDFVSSVDDMNVGMMRFNAPDGGSGEYQYTGGVVTNAIADLETNRETLISTVNAYSGNTGTMLSETLWEARLYWGGLTRKFGKNESGAWDTNAFVGSTHQYKSPIQHQCQKNYTIVLTDGGPTWDNEADEDIKTARGIAACDLPNPGDTSIDSSDATNGVCMDDLARLLGDGKTDDGDAAFDIYDGMSGNQNSAVYTIAFGPGVSGAPGAFLTDVANQGRGRRFDAGDSEGLLAAFSSITGDMLDAGTTFASAAVSVNAFNRSATRDELYFAVFAPDEAMRWDGNLKKYKLAVVDSDGPSNPNPPQLIVADQNNVDAIDQTTGFFKETAKSYWNTVTDGKSVTAGGAANKLTVGTGRKLFTHTAANPMGPGAASNGNDVVNIQTLATATQTSLFQTATGSVTTADVLAFMNASDERRMGDPLHSKPAVVTYRETSGSPVDVVYLATNDGYLHAIDASTGVEKWAFIPSELLPRMKTLVTNPPITTRTFGLDGDIQVMKLDIDGDGIVDYDDGDRVWLFFGMRRGGSMYYALDVSKENDNPSVLWKDGATELPGIGESWSPPMIHRVKVGDGSTQNAQRLVLIFGGGYDADQEGNVQVDDNEGNRIFMVDAKTGTRLWSAGPTGSGANLILPSMTNSFPGGITAIDTDGDAYADRMYAADMGGRVFRFDIVNGQAAASLVRGGVFATLGQGLKGGGSVTPTPAIADTRRFYNAPDVALIQRRGSRPYYNIAIGSGYRGHPLHKLTDDRFYSLRDWAPFKQLSATEYTTMTNAPITEADLTNITDGTATVPVTGKGWRLHLAATGGGEKVLSESTTVNGVILFSTYQPVEPAAATPCIPRNKNRVYAVKVDSGAAALDLNVANNTSGVVINITDRFQEVNHAGILGGVNVGVLRGNLANLLNPGGGGGSPPTVCLAGMHILGKCVQVSDSIRTYWQKNAD